MTPCRLSPSMSASQGAAHRECNAQDEPMQVAESGAILRKRGSKKMERSVSGFADGTGRLELTSDLGTTKLISAAVASVAIVRISNRLRQPIQLSSQSVGAVAVAAPSEPNMPMQPLTNAIRSRGNQMTIAFKPAINAT